MIEPISDVEFSVRFEGDHWEAQYFVDERLCGKGEGSTPLTALMVAEAKARRSAWDAARATKTLVEGEPQTGTEPAP
jgi:hypothetical protein